MKKLFIVTIITLIGIVSFHSLLVAQPVCNTKSLPQLPDVTITSITKESAPTSHCKVAGVIGPEIHFELLLPEKWNGKFVMGGGGGFVGLVVNSALSYGALQAGYATVGTDTGHQGHPLDASWAHNNLERLVNFGHQAIHRTAVVAKSLTRAYYNKIIARNYFVGCSRGGGQALMEAQRYPEDFEGIVAGAPAYNWTMGLGAGTMHINQLMYPDPNNLQEAVIGPKEQELIESSYLAMCDELDGIKDSILNDPRDCNFDVATLLCKGEKTDSCLSKEQLAAVKIVYDGPKDMQGQMFYGYPFGGETSAGGWSRWLTGGLKYQTDLDQFQGGIDVGDTVAPVAPSAHFAFGNGIMKYFVYNNPNWTYKNYKFETFRKDSELAGETLNATNPDLSAFRQQGGKLLMFTGWSDAAISPLATIGYYEKVLAHDKTAVNDTRLFMMPGVEHCFGGPGPSFTNFLTEIDKWVETGKGPEQTVAYWLDEKAQPAGSRLICAYPKIAKYDGKGDPQDASSFSCVEDN